MRSRTTATESGNTYEQLTRTWRLADLIATTLTNRSPPHSITFQHRDLRPWDDIVEATPSGLHAYQVKNLERSLSDRQLAELLQSLDHHPAITLGTLALGHAIVPKSGVDLIVLQGLARASRKANGDLHRLSCEPRETATLAHVATLLDPTAPSPERAFALLRRLDVQILHGNADVREMTIRALHPFFADPQSLARALLEYVVDTGAPGLEIRFDALATQVLAEHPRRESPWLPATPGLPDDEVLLWKRDRRGITRTLWLSTKAPSLIVADLPGLYLGSRTTLWRWSPSTTLAPFLVADDLTPPVPDDVGSIVLQPLQDATLEDTVTGARLPLGLLSDLGFAWAIDLDHTVEPIASLDTILLARAHAVGDYGGGGNPPRDAAFLALDLDHGQPFPLWSPAEAAAYVARLGPAAAHELHVPPDPDPPTLTLLQPSSALPAVLRTYWNEHPRDDRCGGTRVPSADPALHGGNPPSCGSPWRCELLRPQGHARGALCPRARAP